MKRINWKPLVALVLVGVFAFVGLTSMAADVKVKYSGPSGQGNIIYWSPNSGITNFVLTSNGIAGQTWAIGLQVTNDPLIVAILTALDSISAKTNIGAGGAITADSGSTTNDFVVGDHLTAAGALISGGLTSAVDLVDC